MSEKESNAPIRDSISKKILDKTDTDQLPTVWERAQKMKPFCSFGQTGVCCRNCHMGPCRIIPSKKEYGICGADVDTIVARNFVREVCGGVSAHSDHARQLVKILRSVCRGEDTGKYKVSDEPLLQEALAFYQTTKEELGSKLLAEFGECDPCPRSIYSAPEKTREMWEREELVPTGIDCSVVEMMHRTTMGVDHEYRHLLRGGLRAALADGWVGSALATLTSDILFGTPPPVRSKVNLGVLKDDCVNIVVHGHEPAVSEMLALASHDPELMEYAKSKGASGIQLAGMCCTANEILMRHGIPSAGSMLQQELAIATGLVEMMIVDIQCIMPALAKMADCFHTKVVSVSHLAKTPGVEHIEFRVARAFDDAKNILKKAIDNFANRDKGRVTKIDEKDSGVMEMVAGFSNRSIFEMLGGSYRSSFRPLNDAIIQGRIAGICGVIGCSNPKIIADNATVTLVKELIKNNILVVQTGCAAIACAKEGLLTPEAAKAFAGPGLAEVCEAVGIPPVLHMGSCVDNSRILMAATNILKEGGLGESIADLPVAGSAPEWMSEKAVAIGSYFVASGVYTVLGLPLYTSGSEKVTRYLCDEIEKVTGGKFAYIEDPLKAAASIIDHINAKRERLGIHKKSERKLLDMKDRRQ